MTTAAVTGALLSGLAAVPASAHTPVARTPVTHTSVTHASVAHAPVAQAEQERASWRYVWGPSTITRTYFAEHQRRWNSGAYTTAVRTHGVWYSCQKNKYVRITVKNLDTNNTVLNTGLQKCTGGLQTKKATGAYRAGQGLRVYVSTGTSIPWVKVGAVQKR
ncbi:hypothetical protein [Streptomyces sp. NPDC017941]|uniref:hypothetical protein n=1 Tax=unclassified Streptomyces TaxID=2593676 RepID=UPI0037898CC7